MGDGSDHYDKTNFWLTALITACMIMVLGLYVNYYCNLFTFTSSIRLSIIAVLYLREESVGFTVRLYDLE